MFVEHLNFTQLIWINPYEGQVEIGAWEDDLFEPSFFSLSLKEREELEELSNKREIETGQY